jgi:hypothetical protein
LNEFISSLTRADILQIVQIVLVLALAAISALVWYYDIWRGNFPLLLRLRDVNGVTFRRVRLAPGTHQLRLVLSTRAERHAASYQIELLERDWHSLSLAWRTPHTAPIVSLSGPQITTTNGPTLAAAGNGTNLQLWGPRLLCAPGPMAMVDVTVTATASWKGAIRVEAMAQGEATRRAAIPVVVE